MNRIKSFVIDDEIDLATLKQPKWVTKAIELLKKLPDGKLLTTQALASRTGVVRHSATEHTTNPALAPYRFKRSASCTYWANPRTIEAARKELAIA